MGVAVLLSKTPLMIVLVLYKESIQQIPAYPVIRQLAEKKDIQLIIYDNSPLEQTDALFSAANVQYKHDASNPGLAVAYNWALTNVQEEQLLVVFDQDTLFSASYIEKLQSVPLTTEISAIVPRIMSHEQQISPLDASDYIDHQAQPICTPGLIRKRVMAINSGTAFSVSFLKEIGGFNLEFPLDFLDHWFFWKSDQSKKAVYLIDETFTHDLSVFDYTKISLQRYQSIVDAEMRFYQVYDKKYLRRHQKQLLLRTVKQFFTIKERQIWRTTVRTFLRSRKG